MPRRCGVALTMESSKFASQCDVMDISLAPYYAVKGYFESIHQGLFRLAFLGLSSHKK